MRLDKFVAEARLCTRKIARGLVRSGRVTVDGEMVRDTATKVDPESQVICIDGDRAEWRDQLTLLLHKPTGVLTATRDPNQETVLELVPDALRVRETPARRLAPVGRLDIDTTGLLVLTTDGALNHRLSHPSRHAPKTYCATVSGEALLATDRAVLARRFEQGVALADGTICKPATIEWLSEHEVRIVLREGRYHQVKRMVAACGGVVDVLRRERIGALLLPPDLAQPGTCREATEDEMKLLLSEPPAARDAKEL